MGLLLTLGHSLAPAPTAAQGQNVLVIVADDLGTDKLLSYRDDCSDLTGPCSDVPATPFLDARALDGVRFTNAWSDPVCSPTRSTLITGLHAGRTGILAGVGKDNIGLVPADWTLPEMIAEAELDPVTPIDDYRTAAFGKWHLNGEEAAMPDQDAAEASPIVYGGFDYFEGTMGGLGREFPEEDYCNFDWWKVERDPFTGEASVPVSLRRQTYATSDVVDRSLRWIFNNSDKPWVVYIGFHAPHTPLHRLEVVDTIPHPQTGIVRNVYDCRAPCSITDSYDVLANECHGPMIEAMDDELRRLWEWLELFDEMGIASLPTTILLGDNGTEPVVIDPDVYPADNASCGPGSCEDRLTKHHAKMTVFEGGIRAPLLAWGPQVTASGTVDNLVNTTDLLATVAALVGYQGDLTTLPGAPETLDSQSLVPLLDESVPCPVEGCRAEALAEIRGLRANTAFFSYAYRTEEAGLDYKLVRGCLDCALTECEMVDCPDEDCVYLLSGADGRKELTPVADPDPAVLDALQTGLGAQLADIYPGFDAEQDRCPTSFN